MEDRFSEPLPDDLPDELQDWQETNDPLYGYGDTDELAAQLLQ